MLFNVLITINCCSIVTSLIIIFSSYGIIQLFYSLVKGFLSFSLDVFTSFSCFTEKDYVPNLFGIQALNFDKT